MVSRTRLGTPEPARSPEVGDRVAPLRRAGRAVIGIAVLVVLVASATPARADVTLEDVEEARRQLAEVAAVLQEQVALYEDATIEEMLLRQEVDGLTAGLEVREQELAGLKDAAREHVVAVYLSSVGSAPAGLATADGGLDEASVRQMYLDLVTQADRQLINQLAVTRRSVDELRKYLDDALTQQAALGNDLEELVGEIYAELEKANAAYQEIKAEWDRQEVERLRREEEERLQLFFSTSTTLAEPLPGDVGATTTIAAAVSPAPVAGPPPQAGVLVCPVDGAVTFTDTWGDPRSGGRTHTGTDLLAAAGTPVVAIESGTIWSPSWHWAGGIGLYVNGGSGDRWYYAHLQGYAPGIVDGVRVAAGQLIAYVGSTGNATTPHLHLGFLPGGDYYANPYPIVAPLCL